MSGRGDLPLPPCAGPVVDADSHVVEPRSDPAAQLRHMDSEGIDQAVVHTTIENSISSSMDPAATGALAALSNDRLAAFCAADPRRLFGAALVALEDPVAARELRRAVTALGLVSGLVLLSPGRERALADRAFEAMWDAAEELGVPIAIHEARRPRTFPFDAMLAAAHLIASGALGRHPGLRLVFMGSGSSAVDGLAGLDASVASVGGADPGMALTPSECFARQCAISFDVDERALPDLMQVAGEERMVWGSGAAHQGAKVAGAVAAVRATVAPCRTATQVRLLGLNARRLYRLPSRQTGLPGLLDDYFAAVTAQEIDLVRALFRPDAVFESGDIRLDGLDAISDYYTSKTFTFEDFRPIPSNMTFAGTRMEVDIDVHIGGAQNRVHDVFETDGSRITALRVSGFEEALGAARR